MFKEELYNFILGDMEKCIGCNECMRACPVSKDDELTIALLNEAVISSEPPKGIVKDFALNCVQCARCVPVCPPGVRRDLMILMIKSKIKSYPSKYETYVRIKQPHPSGPAKAAYKLKKISVKGKLGNLYDRCDPVVLREAELLFYPGCYIFDKICHSTVAIMDYLKEDYEVLGGYSSCCGWPQYLQGRLDMADELLEHLWELIKKVNPKRIITSCAECLAALRKLKAVKGADFTALTTTEYYLSNIEDLPLSKITDKTMGFHESCHISRKYRKDEAPRQLLSLLGDFNELENNHESTMCCYYYNFEHDPNNEENRRKRLQEVRNVADVMVTDCITCHDVYHGKLGKEGVEILDINNLVYECIKKETLKNNDGGN